MRKWHDLVRMMPLGKQKNGYDDEEVATFWVMCLVLRFFRMVQPYSSIPHVCLVQIWKYVGSIIFQTWNRPKDVLFKHMLAGCTSRMVLSMLPRGQLEKEAAAIWAAKTYQLWNRKVFLRYLYILSQPRFAHNNVESSNHWKLQRGRLACPSY